MTHELALSSCQMWYPLYTTRFCGTYAAQSPHLPFRCVVGLHWQKAHKDAWKLEVNGKENQSLPDLPGGEQLLGTKILHKQSL